jgi:hypothetical protein
MHHISTVGNIETIEFLAEAHHMEPGPDGFEPNYGYPSNTWHGRETSSMCTGYLLSTQHFTPKSPPISNQTYHFHLYYESTVSLAALPTLLSSINLGSRSMGTRLRPLSIYQSRGGCRAQRIRRRKFMLCISIQSQDGYVLRHLQVLYTID